MACVTHLVELEGAMPRFCKRGAKVWAVCADSLSGFRIPLRASIGSTEAPGEDLRGSSRFYTPVTFDS